MATFGTVTATQPHNPNKDIEVAQPPNDGISSMCFNPKANFLVATSWDNQVRCWEIQGNGASVPKAGTAHDQPVLCSAWKDDGTTVFSGGCDKQAKMWPLMSGGAASTVGVHDAPISKMAWIGEMNLLVTASWDKTIKYWDTRQATPAHTQALPERPYGLSVRHPLMVVATADRHIIVYNLASPQTEYKRVISPLKYQTRCVATFPDKSGYLVGSIEGRVAVQHVEENQQQKNFTFKCHRDGNDIYAVNSIDFHPQFGTFTTAGSDGAYNFWDKDSKQRLKAMQRCSLPISCSAFNHDGTIFAYAVSYDWSKGAESHNPAVNKNYILLHATQESELATLPPPVTSQSPSRCSSYGHLLLACSGLVAALARCDLRPDVSTHLRKGPVTATWHATATDGVAARASALPALRARHATRGASLRVRASTPVDYDSSQDATETEEEGGESGALSIERILKQAADAYQSEDEAAVATVEAQLRAMEADRQGLAERLESLTAEISTAKDRFLRLNADFDNFRKRSEREKLAMAATVRSDVVEALLPMIDSFERAKDGVKADTEAERKIDGAYQGIYRQFVEVLRGLGVAAVETVGKEFDPNVHDAIMREDSTEHPEGVVIQEFRKGFVIGDKLIRPAMVKVSAGPGPAGAGDAAADGAAAGDDGVSEGSDAEAGEKSE
ncbi:unnamed protein product [Closterium sp. Yama58-4]|nr:unnamed protein product [Closterium sp. Yama58-4]